MESFRDPARFLRRGLRTNPFCQLGIEAWAASLPVPAWIEALIEAPWDCLVIHGESGAGKSTGARLLCAQLQARGVSTSFHRLNRERAPWPLIPAGIEVAMVDSIQRLAWWRRGALRGRLKRARHVLVGLQDITVGRRLAASIRVTRCSPPRVTASEARRVFEARLEQARRPDWRGPLPGLSDVALELLLMQSAGHWLRLHECLYAAFEALPPSAATIDEGVVRAALSSAEGAHQNKNAEDEGDDHEDDDRVHPPGG